MKETLKKHLGLVLGVAVTATCAAGDSTWNNPAGGDMADGANWVGEVPTGGWGCFYSPVSGPLTLSADLTMMGIEFKYAPSYFQLELGAERTLTVGGSAHVRAETEVELKSGTFKMKSGCRFFIGDNCYPATFTVNGASSEFYGAPSSGGFNFIQVGSANSNFKSYDNRLVVTNGGLVNGWVVVGRLANEQTELCGTNKFIVTGAGSRFVSTLADLTVGAQQGLAQCILDDHATATISKGVYLGECWQNGSAYYAGRHNRLVVTNGATLAATKDLHVGHNSSSNRLEISAGGQVSAARLYTSSQTNVLVRKGQAPYGNAVTVSGEGSVLDLSRGLTLGGVAKSYVDLIEVVDDGTLETHNNECYVGYGGTGHRLRVANGGTWKPGYFTYIGANDVSNTLEVAAGGTVVASNQFRHTAYSRYDGGANGWNTLWVHGEGASFTLRPSSLYHIGRHDVAIEDAIRIEDGGAFVAEGGNSICIPYSQATNAYARGFSLSVTGANSRYVQSRGELVFAYANGYCSTNENCRLYVADGGALVFTNSSCYFGNGNSEGTSVSRDNLVRIAAGGQMEHYSDQKHSVVVGNWQGAEGNRLLVEGTLVCTNTARRGDDTCVGIGLRGASNVLEVANGGRMTVSGPTLNVGLYEDAHGCGVLVRSKATLELARTEWANVGRRGRGTWMRIDDATVDATNIHRICVGGSASASNATLAVMNGGVLSVPRIVVGDGACGCSLVVSNATVEVTDGPEGCSYPGWLQLGYGTTGVDAQCVIAGRDARLRCLSGIQLKNAGTALVFDMPAGGYADTPIRTGELKAATDGTTIRVRIREEYDWRGQDVPLVELDVGKTFSLSSFATDLPDGVRLLVRGNRLIARMGRRGCAVIVR